MGKTFSGPGKGLAKLPCSDFLYVINTKAKRFLWVSVHVYVKMTLKKLFSSIHQVDSSFVVIVNIWFKWPHFLKKERNIMALIFLLEKNFKCNLKHESSIKTT